MGAALEHLMPNLTDYVSAYRTFLWERAAAGIAGLPDGRGINIAHEAVDVHVLANRADRVALRLLGKDGTRREVSYGELSLLTNQFANVLAGLGIERGDVVVTLCGRGLDLYVAVLGALKHGCIVSPMFAAFGPDPVRTRLTLGEARVLLTTAASYERKVAPWRGELTHLDHVLVTGGAAAPVGATALEPLLAAASDRYEIGVTDPEDPALLHFTSGTTGTPKGALHVHGAVLAHHVTGRLALDLHDGDVFWCTADPGWVTGTSYGIIAPLTCGATVVVDEAEIDPARWYAILADEAVDVWYTAPTAVRMLMRAGPDVPGLERPRPHLRLIASVGEPLHPDAVMWGRDTLGLAIHDNWWQTETGGIMVANFLSMPIKPGSMGRPLPGVEVGIVRCDDEGVPVRHGNNWVETIGGEAEGMLAIRAGWPSMFRGYLHDPDRYDRCFALTGVRAGDGAAGAGIGAAGPDGETEPTRWYLTGDLVRRDGDGYLWFVSRADDVIKTSGHLIGPFEVERVLTEHPAVAEAGVYAVPDEVAGALVHAVVSLRPGSLNSDELRRSILGHARARLGAAVAPRQILVVADLPKTRSGKIMRRVLRARELGLPEGDLSMLEVGP